jgi:acyl carrier protein
VVKMSDVTRRLQKLISDELAIDIDKVLPDADLFDDLNFDSLDTVEMVISIESEFDIEIDDDDIDALRTVRQISDLVQNLV